MLLASFRTPHKRGVTLDYNILSANTYSNWIFSGTSTYLISGPVTLRNTTVIEGGTVIKFSKNVGAKISIAGSQSASATIACTASAYRLAVLTASDDNSVGETISGSNGTPSNYYASYAISWDS